MTHRQQAPAPKRGCGYEDRGDREGIASPPEEASQTLGTGTPSPFSPPAQTTCAGCEAAAPTHPCARCWETSYCSEECARNHWPAHQLGCLQGACCGGCVKEDQYVWCADCNKVAYCSIKCSERDNETHTVTCDRRWKTAVVQEAGGGGEQAAAGSSRAESYRSVEEFQVPPLRDLCEPSRREDHPTPTEPTESEGVEWADEHKQAIIDMLPASRPGSKMNSAA
jgi:hypothetical protein